MKRLMRMLSIAAALVLLTPNLVLAQADTDPVDANADNELAQAEGEIEEAVTDEAPADLEEASDEAVTLTEDDGAAAEEEQSGSIIAPFSASFSISDTFTSGAIFRA